MASDEVQGTSSPSVSLTKELKMGPSHPVLPDSEVPEVEMGTPLSRAA